MVSGCCDVVSDIARQYPIPIICALLGAPANDWKLFSDWTDDIFKAFSWNVAKEADAILTAWEAVDDYVDAMVADRRDALTDDLISELIRAEHDGDRLDIDELADVGRRPIGRRHRHHTQPAGGLDSSTVRPPRPVGTAEPSTPSWPPTAVEETMRHSPIAWGTVRVALEDVELAGVIIPAGTLVVTNTASANRDPAVYDHPERLDITREDAPAMQIVRRGHALLPGRESRPARTRRGLDGDDAAHAQCPAKRDRPHGSR